MRVRAALRGDLRKVMQAERRGAATAVTKGIRAQTRVLKQRLRRQTTSAGLSRRLANTWRDSVLPKSGASLAATGVVYSKAPHIVIGLSQATTIRATGRGSASWLAIPTEAAPKRGAGGKRIDPSNFPEHVYGRLRYVYVNARRSLLVVDGLVARRGKRGGFRRATVRKARGRRGDFVSTKGLATVVMFVLVRQVRTRRRLDLDAALREAADGLPRAVVDNWPNLRVEI